MQAIHWAVRMNVVYIVYLCGDDYVIFKNNFFWEVTNSLDSAKQLIY